MNIPNPTKLHWNYYLALEEDLERTARYVEFCDSNMQVFSIEFAHLLLAAASEVDVLAKAICTKIAPKTRRRNIEEYRTTFARANLLPRNKWEHVPNVGHEQVFIRRFGITLSPWQNWSKGNPPGWWRAYNRVKHQRDAFFQEATLQNAINALGALLILNFHFCQISLGCGRRGLCTRVSEEWVTMALNPEPRFMRLQENYYYSWQRAMRDSQIETDMKRND